MKKAPRPGTVLSWLVLVCSLSPAGRAQAPATTEETRMTDETFRGLELRNLGPALMSGRISDIAVDPSRRSTWYVTVASGGVWKTTNRGTTWKPIFDGQDSYSIGCVALDPRNPDVVWIGTGENNSQRSVGYGDGVYKSLDGGESWTRVGLETSEHIGKIVIDPRDSDVVWVAAQGPLWKEGGERGLYKTTDGGGTWERVLHVSENTGISDVVLDPRDPDTLYAASYQRRRHVGIVVAGGPESAVFKSTDGGESWRELQNGLPNGSQVDVGRIGLAISPIDPDVLYAQIAAEGSHGGFFRSSNRGETWRKTSDYVNTDPQYYMELFPDPHRFDRVYVMDVVIHVTDDGGETFERVNTRFKHVDNHAMVFDPDDPDYLMVGCDGGLYESWDKASTWKYVANLPITQFYRVGIDNAEPFYSVYGGTQDNNTLGAPARTNNVHGIRNSDWVSVVGGDGFQARVDPENPDIVYGQSQYAGIVRFDRRSGERIDIQPQPEPGEPALQWNWDSPLVISPHDGRRLYFGANRLFRSDDRGSSWRPVSPDLTRGLDRNQREVMGRIWSPEAVWKNVFTSTYGNLVALDESPLEEGLLYAGADDGLISVSEDGGASWRSVESVPGAPARSDVADLVASRHAVDRVYAVFNNHKEGDFAPYVCRSDDRGRSWRSIVADLPERHVTWTLVEDHEREDLLFVGTEFGLFFTVDGGDRWTRLRGGVPPVGVRDLEIQRREDDLVVATFGRGMLVLDDYSALREVSDERLAEEALLFPVKDPWMYIEAGPLGGGEKASQGDAFFTAPNPPFGAVFTVYLRDSVQTLQEQRKAEERRRLESGEGVEFPTFDRLREEDREPTTRHWLTVRDEEEGMVRRLPAPSSAGFHRVAWDLRYPSLTPIRAGGSGGGSGPLALPGRYSVTLERERAGEVQALAGPQTFEAKTLGLATLEATDREALVAFQRRAQRLQRAVLGAGLALDEAERRLEALRTAMAVTPDLDPALGREAERLRIALLDLRVELSGDDTVRNRRENVPPAIADRVDRVTRGFWSATSAPTGTHRRSYEIAAEAVGPFLDRLRQTVEVDLRELERQLEEGGAPWTPGRGVPRWRP